MHHSQESQDNSTTCNMENVNRDDGQYEDDKDVSTTAHPGKEDRKSTSPAKYRPLSWLILVTGISSLVWRWLYGNHRDLAFFSARSQLPSLRRQQDDIDLPMKLKPTAAMQESSYPVSEVFAQNVLNPLGLPLTTEKNDFTTNPFLLYHSDNHKEKISSQTKIPTVQSSPRDDATVESTALKDFTFSAQSPTGKVYRSSVITTEQRRLKSSKKGYYSSKGQQQYFYGGYYGKGKGYVPPSKGKGYYPPSKGKGANCGFFTPHSIFGCSGPRPPTPTPPSPSPPSPTPPSPTPPSPTPPTPTPPPVSPAPTPGPIPGQTPAPTPVPPPTAPFTQAPTAFVESNISGSRCEDTLVCNERGVEQGEGPFLCEDTIPCVSGLGACLFQGLPRFSLLWEGDDDLDLRVITPNGDEISKLNRVDGTTGCIMSLSVNPLDDPDRTYWAENVYCPIDGSATVGNFTFFGFQNTQVGTADSYALLVGELLDVALIFGAVTEGSGTEGPRFTYTHTGPP
uniref:Uncharacterized protein n=1 Tax=Entomoneis paludosa TaxID=265537 RepID=A0A7S2VFU1_9STRA|mmetsp:Transcript_16803/g.34701  ORF Transcript_16803/g.34701 Transcript_16803/m.34701 type:complete len:509 (+) Transcript_16803:143-1669(+)